MAVEQHEGGCHCGAVRFTAKLDLDQPVMECNCSHCQAKGFLLSFVPAGDFELQSGQDRLTEYHFNKRRITHLFCSTCGVQPFARGTGPDGQEMAAINVRALDGIDLGALQRKPIDGRSF